MTNRRWAYIVIPILSLGLGVLAVVPVVKSANGYIGSIIFFPMLLLVAVATLILAAFGIVMLATRKSAGPFVLAAAFLIPCGFFGGATVSKYFEIGAYYQEPMRPIVPTVANKVVFKKDATHAEVQDFWRTVLGEPVGESGERNRPGVRSVSSNPPENGHEIVTFAFFDDATDEQKADIRGRIMAYPPVYQYLEGVDTNVVTTEPESPSSTPVDSTNRIPKRVPNVFEYRR